MEKGLRGRKSKVKGLFLPPADTGTVHPRGVSAITICNERGRHWGIGTCRWFWRGSKISARCSAWSGREKQKQHYCLFAKYRPIQCLRFLLYKHSLGVCFMARAWTPRTQKAETGIWAWGQSVLHYIEREGRKEAFSILRLEKPCLHTTSRDIKWK